MCSCNCLDWPASLKTGTFFHHAWTQAYCLLFCLFFLRVHFTMTPTSCQAVSLVISPTDTKGFHVVSFNWKPFVQLALLQLSTLFTCGRGRKYCRYKELFYVLCSLQHIMKGAAVCLQRYSTHLISIPPETLYLCCPFSLMSTYSSSLLLQLPHITPYQRPLAFTACCAACLSLFYQPHVALYSCSPCLWWMSLPLPYSVSLAGTRGQNVDE